MYLRIKIFLPVFFLLLASGGRAQDLEKDLAAIVSSLDSASSVSIKTSVGVYDQKGGKKRYGAEASLLRSKNATLSILDGIENYENQEYSVSVDHEEQAIMIAKKDKHRLKPEDLSKAELKKLQKLLSEPGSQPKTVPQVKLLSEKNGVKKYTVAGLQGMKSMSVTLDMQSLAIVEMTYEYSDQATAGGQYIQIQYTEFKKGTDLSAQLVQKRYFTLKEGKYVLNQAYKTYELYTQP